MFLHGALYVYNGLLFYFLKKALCLSVFSKTLTYRNNNTAKEGHHSCEKFEGSMNRTICSLHEAQIERAVSNRSSRL